MLRLTLVVIGMTACVAVQAQTLGGFYAPPSAQEIVDQLRPPGGQLERSGDGETTVVGAEAVDPKAQTIDIRVNFEFDSAALTADGELALGQLGEALMDPYLRPYRFVLAGHTDAVGDAAYNQALSERRAAAVRRYLTTQFDIDPERLETVGYGESRLLVPVETENWQNRRVQITNLGEQ